MRDFIRESLKDTASASSSRRFRSTPIVERITGKPLDTRYKKGYLDGDVTYRETLVNLGIDPSTAEY